MTRKITAAATVLALLATGCSASTDSSAPGGTLITGGTSTATSTPTPSSTTPAPATTTTAGRTPTVTEVTASPSAEASTTAASTTAVATPTVSLDPSPLAGTGGGPQQPSSVPTLNSITDEDRGRALEAAKAIVAAYTSGKPYKEWSEELYPMVDPEVQKEYGPNARLDQLRGTVTSAQLVDDPTLKTAMGENPYWVTVRVNVMGGTSPAYYVRVHRTAEQPDTWKAAHILDPEGYKLFVEERLKRQNR